MVSFFGIAVVTKCCQNQKRQEPEHVICVAQVWPEEGSPISFFSSQNLLNPSSDTCSLTFCPFKKGFSFTQFSLTVLCSSTYMC